jgi:hypothetical protein
VQVEHLEVLEVGKRRAERAVEEVAAEVEVAEGRDLRDGLDRVVGEAVVRLWGG